MVAGIKPMEQTMAHAQPRRLADNRIDYDYCHRRLRRMRRVSRLRAGQHCARLLTPIIGAAAIVAAFILIPAGIGDCVICGPDALKIAVTSLH